MEAEVIITLLEQVIALQSKQIELLEHQQFFYYEHSVYHQGTVMMLSVIVGVLLAFSMLFGLKLR